MMIIITINKAVIPHSPVPDLLRQMMLSEVRWRIIISTQSAPVHWYLKWFANMASPRYIVITGGSNDCPRACARRMQGSTLSLFIFTISHRHDIISNELRTAFTVNFVGKEKNGILSKAWMLFILQHFGSEAGLLFCSGVCVVRSTGSSHTSLRWKLCLKIPHDGPHLQQFSPQIYWAFFATILFF